MNLRTLSIAAIPGVLTILFVIAKLAGWAVSWWWAMAPTLVAALVIVIGAAWLLRDVGTFGQLFEEEDAL